MLIYLDSKDLINLLDGSTSVRVEEFIAELQAGSHHLVVSFPTIIEIAGPLLSKYARSNVMRLLAQLEKRPLLFLNEARLDPLELREAVDAFSAGQESRTVNPLRRIHQRTDVNRFDECIPVEGPPLTRLYLRATVSRRLSLICGPRIPESLVPTAGMANNLSIYLRPTERW